MRLIHGDCLEVLPTLEAASVDAVVTDPPAGIGFMGKEWDDFRRSRNGADAGRENVFGRTSRTGPEYGRRDREMFVAFLTAALAECLRVAKPGARLLCWAIPRTSHWTGTAIEDAGWVIEDRISHLFGTGFPKAKSKLKPACEDWWLARKPSRGVPELQIDACRVEGIVPQVTQGVTRRAAEGQAIYGAGHDIRHAPQESNPHPAGRWPANLCLTCCGNDPHDDDCPVRLLDEQSGSKPPSARRARTGNNTSGWGLTDNGEPFGYGDSGGASRFFYCAKASRKDRGEGNAHPTVKNTELMRWLCRLITPPGGTVLDPFMGSGSTGKAALAEGLGFVGVEKDVGYFAAAEKRLREAAPLFAEVSACP